MNNRIEYFKFFIKRPFWEELYQLNSNEDWRKFCNSILFDDDEYLNLIEKFTLEEALFLINQKDHFVSKMVAATCPYEIVLNKLIDEDKNKYEFGSIKNYISYGRHVPLSILEKLSNDLSDWSLLLGIANNENASANILDRIARNLPKKGRYTVASAVAENRNTSSDTLEFLVDLFIEERKRNYIDTHFISNIVKHDNANEETLIKINNNTDSLLNTEIKVLLVKNPNTPKKVKDILEENHWTKMELEDAGCVGRLFAD